MADIASELAKQCGISKETAQKGMGIVLGLIKSKLPAESFSKVISAVPEGESMMASAASSAEGSAGGVVNAVTGTLGKLFGGAGTGALLAKITQLGMSPDQIQSFFTKIMEFFKGKLPQNVMSQVTDLLPTPQGAGAGT
jgi:hypothetical protein